MSRGDASLQDPLLTPRQPNKFRKYGIPSLAISAILLNILEANFSLAGIVNGNFWSNYDGNYAQGCNDALTHSASNPPTSTSAEVGSVDDVFTSNNIPFQGGILTAFTGACCYLGGRMLMTKEPSIPFLISAFTLAFGWGAGIPASLTLWAPDNGVPDGSYMGYKDGYAICSNATMPTYSSQYTFPSTQTYLNTTARVLLSLALNLTITGLGAVSGDRLSYLFEVADDKAKASGGCCVTEMNDSNDADSAAAAKAATAANFT